MPNNNGGGRRGFGGTPSPEAEALQKALDDKRAQPPQIKDLLAKYEASQKGQAKPTLTQAPGRTFAKVLSVKREGPGHPAGDCCNNQITNRRKTDVPA